MLLNQAEITLAGGQTAPAAALFEEARGLLEKAHPNDAENAWRYAVFDAARAPLLAAQGDAAGAARLIAAAQPALLKRFGEQGFYSQLAQRRAQLLAGPRQ